MLGNALTYLSLSLFQNFHLDSDWPKGIGQIWICSVAYNFCVCEEAVLYEQTLLVKITVFDICSHRRLSVRHILKNHIDFNGNNVFC